jgi:hypothetical protein
VPSRPQDRRNSGRSGLPASVAMLPMWGAAVDSTDTPGARVILPVGRWMGGGGSVGFSILHAIQEQKEPKEEDEAYRSQTGP